MKTALLLDVVPLSSVVIVDVSVDPSVFMCKEEDRL